MRSDEPPPSAAPATVPVFATTWPTTLSTWSPAAAATRASPSVVQHHDERAGAEKGAAALHHQLEHTLQIGLGAHRVSDRRRGLETAHRSLQVRVPALQARVQASVVDGDGGPAGKHLGRLLVALVEVPSALLVGEVEVAVDLVANPDRHAEERSHRRVLRREPVGVRMRRHVVQA